MDTINHYDQINFPEMIRSHHMMSSRQVTDIYHMHDSYEMLLFLGGNTDYYIEHHCYHLNRGDLLVINNREIHRVVSRDNKPYERIATHFYPDLVRGFCTEEANLLACFEERGHTDKHVISLNPPALERYLALADQMHTALTSDTFGHDIMASTYLLQMLVLVNTCFHDSTIIPENIMPQLSYQIMGYINSHLTEDITVQALAGHFYMNRSYMSRKFREQAGCSIQEYIILKRVSLAKTLLSEGKSVSEACELSGFHDYSNFIRTFKKYAGTTPGHYGQNIIDTP